MLIIDALVADLAQRDDDDRRLLTIDLADALEKYIDFGVGYFGDGQWMREATADRGDRLIYLAVRLGHPALAEMLKEAFSSAAARPSVPDELRQTGQKYLALVIPPSCRKRWSPIVREWLRRRWRELRPRSAVLKKIGLKLKETVAARSLPRIWSSRF